MAVLKAFLLSALVAFVIIAIVALILANAQDYDSDPRQKGKIATLQQLAQVKPEWVPRIEAATVAGVLSHPLPFVAKPQKGTCAGIGVCMITSEPGRVAFLKAAQEQDLLQSYCLQDMVTQACEARIVVQREMKHNTWQLVSVVLRDTEQGTCVGVANVTCADLERELHEVCSRAFPDLRFLALDVMTASVEALQRGRIHVLEVNGAMGVRHDMFVDEVGNGLLMAGTMVSSLGSFFWERCKAAAPAIIAAPLQSCRNVGKAVNEYIALESGREKYEAIERAVNKSQGHQA